MPVHAFAACSDQCDHILQTAGQRCFNNGMQGTVGNVHVQYAICNAVDSAAVEKLCHDPHRARKGNDPKGMGKKVQ